MIKIKMFRKVTNGRYRTRTYDPQRVELML